MKSPYGVLGVTESASPSEIRAAYVQRAKVLHPDRFDRASQPAEWQMANDMLSELNEAYGQLNVSLNGGSSHGAADSVDLARTQEYWNQLEEVLTYHANAATEVKPFLKDNFDEHLGSLSRYVGANFTCQQGMSLLAAARVDPAALSAANRSDDILKQYSELVTRRIALVSRAKQLKEKYPFWKMLWSGYSGLNIRPAEFQLDQEEWKNIDPQLEEIGRQIVAVDASLKENLQAAAMQLLAKYGPSIQI